MSSKFLARKLFAVVALAVFVVGCGDEPEADNQSDDNQANQTNQQNNDDNGDNDDNNDNGDPDLNSDEIEDPEDDCEEAIDRSASFEISRPEDVGPITGMELARVGDELWTTYLAEHEEDGQEVDRAYKVRLDCGGEVLGEPMELGTDESDGEESPSLGTDDEIAYLAWVEQLEVTVEDDDGEESTELQTRARGQAFETDGTAVTDEPFDIEVDLGGDEPADFLTAVDVDVNHDGHAVVLAQHIEGMEAQVVFQRLDEEGQFDGAGFVVEPDAGANQSEPAVSVRDDYHVLVAYLEETGWGTGGVRHASIRPDGDEVDEGPTNAEADVSEGNDSQSLAVTKNDAGGYTWMSYELGLTENNVIRARSGIEIGVEEGESTTVSGQASFGPDISASETGGAKTWISTGDGNGVHFRRFEAAATAIIDTGPVIDQYDDIEEGEVAGEPAIAWLTDDIYAAVWPEVDGPVGRIIDFEWAEELAEE